MADETYYSVLEVLETASTAEIRAAYRRLINEVHPDRLMNAPAYWQRKAEEKSKEINEAFGVLSNPEKRKVYDARLHASRGASRSPGRPTGQQPQESGEYQSSDGSGYGPSQRPPREPRSQVDPDATTRRDRVPRSPSSPPNLGLDPPSRLFFSLILALFAFGAAVDFWDASSVGDGIFPFALSVGLLFAIACLYQRRISRVLLSTRLRTPRQQLLATAGVITVLLLAGKVVSSRQNASPHTLPVVSPSANAFSPTQPGTRMDPSAARGRWVIPVSLPNGTEILKRRRIGGHGKFTVDNGTGNDAVVALVDVGTKRAIRAFYVGAGRRYTEQQIGPGTFSIFYMTGLGWDASTRQFNRSGECGVFDQTATFAELRNEETGETDYHEFSITLQPVAGGNAHTSEVGADAFKSAIAEGDLQ